MSHHQQHQASGHVHHTPHSVPISGPEDDFSVVNVAPAAPANDAAKTQAPAAQTAAPTVQITADGAQAATVAAAPAAAEVQGQAAASSVAAQAPELEVPPAAPSALELAEAENARLRQELTAAKAKAQEMQDLYLRAKAESENVRRRAQEDVTKAHKFALEKFANDLLSTKDSLEAALAAKEQSVENFHNGVDLILKQLSAAFNKHALLEVNPVGEKFDPYRHQAISMVPADADANTVINVLQKGYLIADRVLRPAMVMVSSGRPAAPAEENIPPAAPAGA